MIVKVSEKHLEDMVPLFDGYRVFYEQPSDSDAARAFLKQRLSLKDSVIFMAISDNGEAAGFTQLYPSFSSVAMQRVYILNDLYVKSAFRGQGVGASLMNHAKAFARTQNARGLTLETAIDNPAQHLYERLGWVKDTEVFHYTWETKSES